MLEDILGNPEERFNKDHGFDLLKELEQNTPEEIRRQRAHFRFMVKVPIILQPGNASQIREFKVQGVTGDISEGGLGALFPIPVNVGDIYRLQFDRKQIDLPMVYALCMRCSMVRDDAFSSGFKFFSAIELPYQLSQMNEVKK